MIRVFSPQNILFKICFLFSTSICHAIIGGGQGANSGPGPGPFGGGGACRTLFSGNYSHSLDYAPSNQIMARTQILSIPSSPKEWIEVDEYNHTVHLVDLNTNKTKQIHRPLTKSSFNDALYGLFNNSSNLILKSIHVLDRDHLLVIHTNGNYFLLNFRTEQVIGSPLTFEPMISGALSKVQISFSPDRRYFYVLERDKGRITRVEWSSGSTLQISLGSANSSASGGSGQLSLVKQAMAKSTDEDFFQIPDPQSGKAYFSSDKAQDIYQVDLRKGTVTSVWTRSKIQRSALFNTTIDFLPFDLGPHHRDKFAMVRLEKDPANGIDQYFIDLIYLENPIRVETKKLPIPKALPLSSLAMTEDGTGLYVALPLRKQVALVDLKSMKVVNTDPFQFPLISPYEITYLSQDSLIIRQDSHFSIFKK